MPYNLDRLVNTSNPSVVVTYDEPDTIIELPYEVDAGNQQDYFRIFREDTGAMISPSVMNFQGNEVTVENVNLTGVPLQMGVLFYPVIELSTIFPRNDQDVPVAAGRTNIRYLKIWYDNTKAFQVVVERTGAPPRTYSFSADEEQSGEFSVPIHGQNTAVTISIISLSGTPVNISGYSWEGVYYNRTGTPRRL